MEASVLGPLPVSITDAERSTLFWAVAWVLQQSTPRPYRVWTDSLVASGQTGGRWGSDEYPALQDACRSIAQASETARLPSAHVRGHGGDPLHELVDVLSKSYHLPDTVIPDPFAQLPAWAAEGSLKWLWLYYEAARNLAQWPTLQGACFVDRDGFSTPLPTPNARLLSLPLIATKNDAPQRKQHHCLAPQPSCRLLRRTFLPAEISDSICPRKGKLNVRVPENDDLATCSKTYAAIDKVIPRISGRIGARQGMANNKSSRAKWNASPACQPNGTLLEIHNSIRRQPLPSAADVSLKSGRSTQWSQWSWILSLGDQ